MTVDAEGKESPLIVGVPGDREVDVRRLEAALHPLGVRPFEEGDFARFPALVKGYIGPEALGEARGLRYLVDPRVVEGTRWITGANQPGRHVFDLVCGRDFTPDGVIDVAEIVEGDACPECGAVLTIARGIEIGHIFQLGRKYAEALDLQVLDETGTLVTVTMGSYGIGVSRAVAAIAEQHHDDKGLVWPREVAPADVHIVVAGKEDEAYVFADRLASDLDAAGVRVLIDDRRGVSPGVKFNDSELIGVPTIVVVGKGLTTGIVEVKDRRTGDRVDVQISAIGEHLRDLVLAS
jgi:prolyl-tRNA synthetase